MEAQNRVQDDLSAFYRQIDQEGGGNDLLFRNKQYLHSKVALLDAIIDKYSKTKDLNEYEKASLTTMLITRNQFYKRAYKNKFWNATRIISSFGLQGIKKVLDGGASLLDGLGSMLKNFTQRGPWLLRLPANIARLALALAAFMLRTAAKIIGFVRRKVSMPQQHRSGRDNQPKKDALQDHVQDKSAAQSTAQDKGQHQSQQPTQQTRQGQGPSASKGQGGPAETRSPLSNLDNSHRHPYRQPYKRTFAPRPAGPGRRRF